MELTIQSLGFLIRFQEDIKISRPHGTINHTVRRVSYTVSGRYQNHPSPGPIEQLTLQPLGFLRGFQEDIKFPVTRPQGKIDHTVKIIIIIIIHHPSSIIHHHPSSSSSSSSSYYWLFRTRVASPGKPPGLAII